MNISKDAADFIYQVKIILSQLPDSGELNINSFHTYMGTTLTSKSVTLKLSDKSTIKIEMESTK